MTFKWVMYRGERPGYPEPLKCWDVFSAEDEMPDLAEMELYCAEARDLIARAEGAVDLLERNGACEGHRMMASQGLQALRHLSRIIELHRNRSAFEALPNALVPPVAGKVAARRNWLSIVRWRPSGGRTGRGSTASAGVANGGPPIWSPAYSPLPAGSGASAAEVERASRAAH